MYLKRLLVGALMVLCGSAYAQNQISAPTGQSLKIVTDTVFVNGHMRINAGILKLNNYRFLSTVGTNNTFVGASGNLTMTASSNTLVGANSGIAITSGNSNNFFGINSGNANTGGTANVFFGSHSGRYNTIGDFNTFVGNSSGNQNSAGSYNVMIGNETGSVATTGSGNTLVGRAAGTYNRAAIDNTMIGYYAGPQNTNGGGSKNVFIGAGVAASELGSDKLYIANTGTTTPLIYGDFSAARLVFYGKAGFNTANFPASVTLPAPTGTVNTSGYQLFVKGGILTENITVQTGWADYVFEKGYRLKPLSEVEAFIKVNGHLPNVPSAGDVEKYGANLGELTRIQQEKIEELTLYAIEHEKQVSANSDLLKGQQREIEEIKAAIKALK